MKFSLIGFLAAAFILLSSSMASAQSLVIEAPAAGAEVTNSFTVQVRGTPGAVVRLLIDGEELSTFTLSSDGRGEVRVAVPTERKFGVEIQQIDDQDVVATASIRLRNGTVDANNPPPVPPIESDEEFEVSIGSPVPNGATATADDPPPPPPPPPSESPSGKPVAPASGESTGDSTPPPPPVSEHTAKDHGEPEENELEEYSASERATENAAGTLGTGAQAPPQAPDLSARLGRILVQSLAGFFAVPTAWIVGVVGVGVVTNFGSDVETEIGLAFAISGVIGSSFSVWLTGEFMKGNGSFLATLAGASIITGLVMLSFMADSNDNIDSDDELILGAIFGSLVGIGGAVAGYELTSDTDADYSEQTGTSDALIGVAPTPDGRGVVVGFSTRF